MSEYLLRMKGVEGINRVTTCYTREDAKLGSIGYNITRYENQDMKWVYFYHGKEVIVELKKFIGN